MIKTNKIFIMAKYWKDKTLDGKQQNLRNDEGVKV
jgi:hypothetical protein